MSSLYTKNTEEKPNKVKTWWGGLPKKNKVIAITATSALVAGIIAGGVAFSIANSQKTYTPQDAISAMLTVDGVKPASIMVAPATDIWWKTVLNASPNASLEAVKFSDISAGAQYVSTSMSKGKQYANASTVGVPTTFVVYDTPANAEAAYQKLMQANMPTATTELVDSSKKLSPVVSGNFLLFIPEGAFSDVDYALKAYESVAGDNAKMKTLSSNQASWTLDFEDFATILNAQSSKESKKVYTDLVSKLGIGKDTTWSGTSSDGITWEGSFKNYQAEKVSAPAQIATYLSSLISYNPGQMELPDKPDTGYDIPITDINQAIIGSCCMIVSNSDSTVGNIVDGTSNIKGAPLGNKGFLEVEIAPNTWMGAIAQRTAYEFTGYKTMTVLVKDKNGASTITLTPFVK